MIEHHKTLVISIPKSGTYLFSEILKICGFIQTNIHISKYGYDDYSSLNFDDSRKKPELGRHYCSVHEALRLIPPHGFAVSHLHYNPDLLEELKNFRLVFLKRDPRESLISMMRFFLESGRAEQRKLAWRLEPEATRFHRFLEAEGEFHLDHFRSLIPWYTHSDMVILDYQDLLPSSGLPLTALERALRTLGVDERLDLGAVLDQALHTQTITKSSSPSSLTSWDEWCDEWWHTHNGNEIMTAFGYTATEQDR